jgi:hypothetical protein
LSSNPGVDFELIRDKQDNTILGSLSIVMPGAVSALPELMDQVGIDFAHFKNLRCVEEVLAAAGTTNEEKPGSIGNMVVGFVNGRYFDRKSILLAVCISPTESNNALDSLFPLCEKTGLRLNDSRLTIVSDGGTALDSSTTKHLPETNKLRCADHLTKNIKTWGLSNATNLKLFWSARNSTTVIEMKSHLDRMEKHSPKLFAHLSKIPNWCIAPLIEKGRSLGGLRASITENNFSGVTLESRFLSPFNFFRKLVLDCASIQSARQREVQALTSIVTPKAMEMFNENQRELLTNPRVGHVTDLANMIVTTRRATVRFESSTQKFETTHLSNKKCSCFGYQQTEVPCICAISGFSLLGDKKISNEVIFREMFGPHMQTDSAKLFYSQLAGTNFPADNDVNERHQRNLENGILGTVFPSYVTIHTSKNSSN